MYTSETTDYNSYTPYHTSENADHPNIYTTINTSWTTSSFCPTSKLMERPQVLPKKSSVAISEIANR